MMLLGVWFVGMLVKLVMFSVFCVNMDRLIVILIMLGLVVVLVKMDVWIRLVVVFCMEVLVFG